MTNAIAIYPAIERDLVARRCLVQLAFGKRGAWKLHVLRHDSNEPINIVERHLGNVLLALAPHFPECEPLAKWTEQRAVINAKARAAYREQKRLALRGE